MSEQQQQIKGLPVGVKIVRVSLDRARSDSPVYSGAIKLAPDNAYGVLDLLAMAMPEGWERAGETIAEWFCGWPISHLEHCWLGTDGVTVHGPHNSDCVNGRCAPDFIPGQDTRRIMVRRKKTVRRYLVVKWELWADDQVSSANTVSVFRAGRLRDRFNDLDMHSATIEEVEQ